MKRKAHSQRPTRKPKALFQEARRHVHSPLVEQQRWYFSILRDYYGNHWGWTKPRDRRRA